jgi:hypothetical protein
MTLFVVRNTINNSNKRLQTLSLSCSHARAEPPQDIAELMAARKMQWGENNEDIEFVPQPPGSPGAEEVFSMLAPHKSVGYFNVELLNTFTCRAKEPRKRNMNRWGFRAVSKHDLFKLLCQTRLQQSELSLLYAHYSLVLLHAQLKASRVKIGGKKYFSGFWAKGFSKDWLERPEERSVDGIFGDNKHPPLEPHEEARLYNSGTGGHHKRQRNDDVVAQVKSTGKRSKAQRKAQS